MTSSTTKIVLIVMAVAILGLISYVWYLQDQAPVTNPIHTQENNKVIDQYNNDHVEVNEVISDTGELEEVDQHGHSTEGGHVQHDESQIQSDPEDKTDPVEVAPVAVTEPVATSDCPSGADGAVVTCTDEYIKIESDGLPSHELMVGIEEGGWNGQWPAEQDYTGSNAFLVPRIKVLLDIPLLTKKNTAGVAINGVPIFLPQAPGQLGSSECLELTHDGEVYHAHECMRDPVAAGEMDNCGGHTGRGDDYHYHANPSCLIDSLPASSVVGYMMDGFPVYDGPLSGSREYYDCGGYISSDGEIHYAFTSSFPYVTNCLLGETEEGPSTQGSEVYTGSITGKNSGSVVDYGTSSGGCLFMEFSNGDDIEYCRDDSSQSQPTADSTTNNSQPTGQGKKYCGDGICDGTESVQSCSADCS